MKRKVTILSPWRFTVFLTLAILVVLTAFLLLFNGTEAKNRTHYQSIHVQQGDTLWAIAGNYAPEGMDVREYIYQIKKANDMDRSDIYTGDELLLPVYQ